MQKLVKTAIFFKVNLHKDHCFLLLSNLSSVLQLKKTLFKVFFLHIFKAGSGSAFSKQLDLDTHSDKLLDPDQNPHKYGMSAYKKFRKIKAPAV